jgi:hypothetical protein
MLVELPRRVALWIYLLAIGLASLLDAIAASPGTLVEFPNLPGQTPEDLNGYLARPDTGLAAELGSPSNRGGPFPAVVVLHGCIGITGHFTGIADRLSSWGYVALAVDSLGPRGLADRCDVGILDQHSMPMRRCASCRSCRRMRRRRRAYAPNCVMRGVGTVDLTDSLTLFKRLGVDVPSLSAREFSLAYYRLAKRHHPDQGNDAGHDLMARHQRG